MFPLLFLRHFMVIKSISLGKPWQESNLLFPCLDAQNSGQSLKGIQCKYDSKVEMTRNLPRIIQL